MSAIKGLVAFVTGGASGLGLATVKHLAKIGAAGCYSFDMQATTIEEPDIQPRVASVRGNVCDSEAVKAALEDCRKKFGRIDTIVNCAGVSIAFKIYNFKSDRPHKIEDFRDLIEHNVIGTFNVTRLGVGYIGKNEPNQEGLRGSLINVSGCSGFDGQAGQSAYSAAAGAIHSMTIPLAKDLGTMGIRVNTISVGYFDTPVIKALPENVREFIARSAVCPDRLGKPEDFAHLVQCVIENPYINGSILRIDGGQRFYL